MSFLVVSRSPSRLRCTSFHFPSLLINISSKNQVGLERLAHHSSGLFTVSVCVMSNFSKSRVLSLQVEHIGDKAMEKVFQVLTRMCSLPVGHRMVADAISMLRLRFGEPVRFKFIVGESDNPYIFYFG